MRIKLSGRELDRLFNLVDVNKRTSWKELASAIGVSQRTVRDWKRAKITIPMIHYIFFLKMSGLEESDFKPQVLKDYWHITDAAKKGGSARMKIYGDLGTPEGRRKGGLASLKTHSKGLSGFKILRHVERPRYSEDLAELMGILFGDGHLSEFQVSMTTNSITDVEHAEYTRRLFRKLFRINASITKRKRDNAINVVASSKNLVNLLNKMGMPIGNKLEHGLLVPLWISRSRNYQKAFLRGLFDTDGCIYLDRHIIRGKQYKHMGWTITSYSKSLVEGVIGILHNMGFGPTYRVTQKSVFLRRTAEIVRYFSEIGSSNQKHIRRFQDFLNISKQA